MIHPRKLVPILLAGSALWAAVSAAQDVPVQISPAGAAARVQMRGKNLDIVLVDLRQLRRNDVMVVQADFRNDSTRNRLVYYRFKWIDSTGNQVGDGEPFKQVEILGKQIQTFKSVAPTPAALDFRIEINVDRVR